MRWNSGLKTLPRRIFSTRWLQQFQEKNWSGITFFKKCRIFRCGREKAMRRRSWRKNSLLLGVITGFGVVMLRPIMFWSVGVWVSTRSPSCTYVQYTQFRLAQHMTSAGPYGTWLPRNLGSVFTGKGIAAGCPSLWSATGKCKSPDGWQRPCPRTSFCRNNVISFLLYNITCCYPHSWSLKTPWQNSLP